MPSQPSPSRPARPDGRVRAPADDDRNRGGRRGRDDRLVEVEVRAVEADRRAGQQLANDDQALIHSLAPRRRVHPAHRDLVTVLAAYPDPQYQPSGSELGKVSQLAGHQHGMAQRQQVNTDVDGQRRMEHRQRRGLYEAVESQAEEAHVVAAADVVDARLPGLRQNVPGRGRIPAGQQGNRREHAHPGG
jgi:hypothetical protein